MYEELFQTWRKLEYDVYYASTREDAKEKLFSILPQGAQVALGGSVTLQELGVIERLRNGKYQLIDRYEEQTPEEREVCFKEGLTAQWFLTGTNAITRAGELINIDGNGNRVAPMIYGAQNVCIVIGKNKLVDSIQDGIERIRKIAPMNAKRLGLDTPCTKDGVCHDCHYSGRICNMTTIIHNSFRFPKRIKILFVNETMGY